MLDAGLGYKGCGEFCGKEAREVSYLVQGTLNGRFPYGMRMEGCVEAGVCSTVPGVPFLLGEASIRDEEQQQWLAHAEVEFARTKASAAAQS